MNYYLKLSLFVLFYFYILVVRAEDDDDTLIIQTNSGKVRGINEFSSVGKEVYSWLGIPYAEKPIGDLRFAHPVPISFWDDIYNATTNPNSCIQSMPTETRQSEDCLYLSITVPKRRPQNATVMVWIYGGAFHVGSIVMDLYDYRTLSSEGNIIVAAMQYRVNALGFLHFGTNSAPGNAGLYDQLLALRWIHENIEFFGGNPNDITIFGESAGSTSVALHLLNPLSRNLFRRGILQSGTVNYLINPPNVIIKNGMELVDSVGCSMENNSDYEEIVNCLKGIDAEKLAINPNFSVVADGNFVPDDPWSMVEEYNFNNVSILIGTNSHEGSISVLDDGLLPYDEEFKATRGDLLKGIEFYFSDFGNLTKEAINFMYTNWSNVDDSLSNLEGLDKVLGDYSFTANSIYFAQKYAEAGNDVFQYYYTHRDEFATFPTWIKAHHGAELNYVFGLPLNRSRNFTNDERELSIRIMNYWTNFAKTGDPNLSPDGIIIDVHWPTHTFTDKEYLIIDTNTDQVGNNLRAMHSEFWNSYIPKIRNSEVISEEKPEEQEDEEDTPNKNNSCKLTIHLFAYLVLIVQSIQSKYSIF